jgi:hypothetical protein
MQGERTQNTDIGCGWTREKPKTTSRQKTRESRHTACTLFSSTACERKERTFVSRLR